MCDNVTPWGPHGLHFKCKSQFLLHLATEFGAVQGSLQCQLGGTGILFFSLCAPELLPQVGSSCVGIQVSQAQIP